MTCRRCVFPCIHWRRLRHVGFSAIGHDTGGDRLNSSWHMQWPHTSHQAKTSVARQAARSSSRAHRDAWSGGGGIGTRLAARLARAHHGVVAAEVRVWHTCEHPQAHVSLKHASACRPELQVAPEQRPLEVLPAHRPTMIRDNAIDDMSGPALDTTSGPTSLRLTAAPTRSGPHQRISAAQVSAGDLCQQAGTRATYVR